MELFDAVDVQGNKLGFDLIRGEKNGERIYHKVVQIFTFNQDNHLLVTLRHPDKVFGLHWEVTAGSVIKGEDEIQGAIRELEEETGIRIQAQALKLLYTMIENDAIWYTYFVKTSVQASEIRYQEGETIDHQWIDASTFMRYLKEGAFPEPMKLRIQEHWDLFKQTLKEQAEFDII
jgi:8-oxo-dGTP pyrophosphatase MutT (NUDIX family)